MAAKSEHQRGRGFFWEKSGISQVKRVKEVKEEEEENKALS